MSLQVRFLEEVSGQHQQGLPCEIQRTRSRNSFEGQIFRSLRCIPNTKHSLIDWQDLAGQDKLDAHIKLTVTRRQGLKYHPYYKMYQIGTDPNMCKASCLEQV